MKLNELLLLELREILDRTDYGSWIDTSSNQVHPVDRQGGHGDFIMAKLDQFGVPKQYIQSSHDLYTIGYAHGYVRTYHRPSDSLTVEGMDDALKRAARIIMASAVQPDVKQVVVSKYTDLEQTDHTNMKAFNMPSDRQALAQYLTS